MVVLCGFLIDIPVFQDLLDLLQITIVSASVAQFIFLDQASYYGFDLANNFSSAFASSDLLHVFFVDPLTIFLELSGLLFDLCQGCLELFRILFDLRLAFLDFQILF